MNLIIDNRQVCLAQDMPNAHIFGTTNNALGNVISLLNEEFPGIEELDPAEYAKRIVSSLTRQTKQAKEIFGLKCTPDELFNIISFLNDSDRWCDISKKGVRQIGEYKIDLTMQDVEIWRVRHHITKSVTPLDWLDIDYSQGLMIKNITSIYDVFYGLLYFYAFNRLKLVKCEHCGRWFATTTFKIKYCPRKSTFPGYTHLNCEQAVRNIMQECGRIKNRIDIKAAATPSGQRRENLFVDEFFREWEPLYMSAKDKPTVKNLNKYLSFLRTTEEERGWLK